MTRKTVNFDINPLLSGPSFEARTLAGSPYRVVPISEIDVDPDQPRRVFDKEALSQLAESIKEYGILCPILVRHTAGGTFRLISGERRLRASRLAGLTSIPVVVDTAEDSDASTLGKQLVENLQRSELSSMERALSFGQLRDQFSWTVREIAVRLGLSKSQVQRSLDVLSLPDDLQAALIAGASESKILLLGQVTDRELRKKLLEQIDSTTRASLASLVAEALGKPTKEARVSHGGTEDNVAISPKRATEDKRLAEELQRELGTKVQLLRSKTKEDHGKLVLEFYSNDDLNEVFKRLLK